MKFVVDAQLPPLLCEILEIAGFYAIHVDSLPKRDETSDMEIATFADTNELIVITKDSDFYFSHMLHAIPRKLLLITTGNIKNQVLFGLIRANCVHFKSLFENCDFVELSNEGLIGHKK